MTESTMTPTAAAGADDGLSLPERLQVAWDLEFANLRWRLMICSLLGRLLPEKRGAALRTGLVRAIGLDIGAGTFFLGMPKLTSSTGLSKPRLRIGVDCLIGSRVILEFGEALTLGDRVVLDDGAVILTTTHQLGPREHRAGALVRSPVAIGNDVVIGANAIILPGAIIGDGARVLAQSVVNGRVAPGVTVVGIPARPQRTP